MLIKAISPDYDNYFAEKLESASSTLYAICFGVIVVSYLGMMIEAYYSDTLQSIRNMKSIDEVT